MKTSRVKELTELIYRVQKYIHLHILHEPIYIAYGKIKDNLR